jgi:Uncharacterized conserved protein
MPSIKISSFGPIRDFSGSVDNFVVLIGPQASGKSTITKLVYFFKMLPVWTANYDPASSKGGDFGGFISTIRHKFINLFGPINYQRNMKIEYQFSSSVPDAYCKVCIDRDLVRFEFGNTILGNLQSLIKTIIKDKREEEANQKGFSGIISSRQKSITSPRADYLDIAKQLFYTKQTPIFIPAGRTLLSLLSGQVGAVLYDKQDFIMADFVTTIQKIRPQFQRSLGEIFNTARATQQIQPDEERAKLAQQMIEVVLRGRYAFENNEERIYHNSGFTKLSFASSGQQESIWILLMAYMLILERESTFIIFEEPEAHLFPAGQDAIMRLLTLLYGANDTNGIIVTTHSPYVLSSVNNLIFAEKAGKKSRHDIEGIIHPKFWLKFSDVHSYSMSATGISTDIFDHDLEMIRAEEIDTASRLLNDEFDRMNQYA